MAELSRREYDRLAMQIVTADRQLARALSTAAAERAARKTGAATVKLALLAAALNDLLRETTVPAEHADAHRLVESYKGERPSERAMREADSD